MQDDIQDIQNVPSSSPDLKTELAKKLQELMPEIIADGKVDAQKLKELLADDIGDDTERFGLFWPGKKRAMRAAQEPTTATLKPAPNESKDWDTTKNLFIEGDNLEVLKVMQRQYHNKIKMIYIDPPYNTGKDFVYPDNFKEGLANYLEFTKQVDEGGKKISTNSETEGRYHSNWLNMMYPRLKLARNLLTDDGAIFISIDDNEQDNLKKLCNEIFGEGSFVASFIWKSRQNKDNRNLSGVSVDHEYVLCYSRCLGVRTIKGEKRKIKQYSNPDNDQRGNWTSGNMVGLLSENLRPNCHYNLTNPITGIDYGKPKMGWRYDKNTMGRLIAESRILWPENPEGRPRRKVFLNDLSELLPGFSSIIGKDIYTRNGTGEVSGLFNGEKLFDFPKPVSVIRDLIDQATNYGDIVLDFFSGSGTTAHAVMQLNTEDGGNRRHIQVQLPEPTDEKSEAYKAGYKTIAKIARERINRAGEKIKADYAEKIATREQPLDVGYRTYKLADTNFIKWQNTYTTDVTQLQARLDLMRESSNDNASQLDLLTEIILKLGLELTTEIHQITLENLPIYSAADGSLLLYLDEHITPTLNQLRTILEGDHKPAKFVILEDSFKGDDQLKTNLTQICKSNNIELWTV